MGGDPHDHELVRRSLSGDDRDAFGLLYLRYRDAVKKLAYWRLGNTHDADDATQETFLKAFRQRHSYRATGSFKAWLLRICERVCSDRGRSAKPTLCLDCADPDQHAGGVGTVDAAEWMTVRAAISKLPAQEAVAWFLIAVLGCTSKEAAVIVNVRPGSTMRSRCCNAQKKLRRELAEDPTLTPADPEMAAVARFGASS